MKIIEGIEALIGKDFTGNILFLFSEGSEIKSYSLEVLDGKLLFASDAYMKHFITVMVNQDLSTMIFKKVG